MSAVFAMNLVPLAAQEACEPVVLPPGENQVVISGEAPPRSPVCYLLEGREGDALHLRLLGAGNTMFTVVGVIDARIDYRFLMEGKSYEIHITQMLQSDDPEPFRLRLTISGGKESGLLLLRDPIAIRRLQSVLGTLGYDPGPVDGIFGGKSRAALAEFLNEHDIGLPPLPTEAAMQALTDTLNRLAARLDQAKAEREFRLKALS
ncbi:hypothetical protein GR183_02560 [Stappia sp. GBMRC 2046]|uniref:Peptidoglycan binding-like domain-containing protein n=1 Tax=Stappia sediminis TaxID=2692190 RepID=A0A7X3LRJ7_9HYPH|nr:peptidoglycan-binding domain-containing protein [Stappia sediminis]MXN63775.1 hypothetical protein [Stappia sediminis]